LNVAKFAAEFGVSMLVRAQPVPEVVRGGLPTTRVVDPASTGEKPPRLPSTTQNRKRQLINHMSGNIATGYAIPTEFEELRTTIRQIAQQQIVKRAPDIDRAAEYPQDIRKLLAENDILGLPFAEEYGGTGTGTLMLQIAVEELAKADASCALILMLQELGSLPITLFGTDELKRRFLPKCATGEWAPAFALSEAEAGSNAAAMRASAV
jgi:alkylation response protein AidB-like acyl-CoA dehydrogenase